MFFIMGISDGRKDFDLTQMTICAACGRYGRFLVYMTYTVLSLFFIPTFKWNKQYYVQMSCCGKIYRLNPETGRRIARGEEVVIRPEDLEDISCGGQQYHSSVRKCSNCGYTSDEDFVFCPMCGKRF